MKIICVGMNYAEHVNEMLNELPAEPVLFMKPDTALLRNNEAFYIPSFSNEVHYECELVVKIDRIGKNIETRFASRYYSSVGLGIDFTARDVQRDLRAKALPWEKAKAFDKSAALSAEFIPLEELPALEKINFHLEKNAERVQHGKLSEMIFSIDELIAEISKYYTLKIGDLIFTGTPAGVGRVDVGDQLVGYIENRKMFDFSIK
ncbi:MAG: fumarylacetoacetate hydrolase family protein [Mangrovibacterium sp.]